MIVLLVIPRVPKTIFCVPISMPFQNLKSMTFKNLDDQISPKVHNIEDYLHLKFSYHGQLHDKREIV